MSQYLRLDQINQEQTARHEHVYMDNKLIVTIHMKNEVIG